jgi:DNA repair exonuclease SbcCD ATPase subunit
MIEFSTHMAHDGKILEALLKRLGVKKGTLGELMRPRRSNNSISKYIASDEISNEILIRMGKALRYDLTKEFPRLKNLPQGSELAYFNSDPNQVLKDLEEIKGLKKQMQQEVADKDLEIKFLRERIESLEELIRVKNDLIDSKEDLIKRLKQEERR